MKSFLSFILSILLSVTHSCGGPHPSDAMNGCRVVTEIRIQYDTGGEIIQRRYSDQHKMNKTLLYLRWLDTVGSPVADPGVSGGPSCEILLTLSDGTTRRYEQMGDQYLSIDNAPWVMVDPEKAIRLPLLIAAIPSDAPHG